MRKSVMTRIFATMMAAVAAAGCMAGCGTDTASSENEAVVADNNEENEEASVASNDVDTTKSGNYSDVITIVWYPNESADTYAEIREEVGKLITQATGKEVEQQLTTDYAIAIEALANGTATVGCAWGAEGYIQAQNSNPAVKALFTNSGESGTLDDAMYYSYLAVNEEDAKDYADGSSYSIENIVGKRMSFVSNSSTSGFKVPTNSIIAKFSETSDWSDLTVDDLVEGGDDYFFSEVLFGGSHQGSAFNLLSGKCDVAAFCDTEIDPYASVVSGEEKQVGSVYEVNADADAPFDTVGGEKFTVIASTPVMNGPFVYNSEVLSPEDAQAILDLFTSDEVTNNSLIFYPEDGEVTGMYKKSGDAHFVAVEDAWYDPIRNMQ
ncbi:MAG: phosphate/phosphite/phosphonate ABC transporter substrate-binding protein [Roseburia sp.]